MGGTERLHHRDGLFQFAEACHVEPHERGAAVGEHRRLTLVSYRDARHGPPVMAKRRHQTQQPRPQHTPQPQQKQRHQYQYSFEARL